MKRIGRRITGSILIVIVFLSFFCGHKPEAQAAGGFTIARAVIDDNVAVNAASLSEDKLWIEYSQAINSLVSSGKLQETNILIYPYIAIDGTILLDKMLKVATERNIWILYGAEEYDYETVYICSPEGAFYKYQAMHPGDESKSAGCLPVIINTKFGSFGVALGKDLLYVPELSRYYTAKGCRMILNPLAGTDTPTELMLEIVDGREEITVIDVAPGSGSGDSVKTKSYNLWGPASEDIISATNFNEKRYTEWYKKAAGYSDSADRGIDTDSLKMPVISVVDFNATWGDLNANLNKMLTYIEKADKEGADIIVFPEMALQGYCVSNNASEPEYRLAVDKAITKNGSYAKRLSEKAEECDMYIIFGASEKLDVAGKDKAYNSAFVCKPDGTVETYRKLHIVEGKWCQRGSEPLVVDTKFGKMGIAICKDTYSYPELSRYYMGMGCLYYINISASAAGGDEWLSYYSSRLTGIAIANNMVVVSANLCGYQYDTAGKTHGWYPGRGCVVGALDDYYISAHVKDMSPKTGMKTVTMERSYLEQMMMTEITYCPLLYADMYGNLSGYISEEDIANNYVLDVKEVANKDISNVLRSKLGAGKEYVNYREYEVEIVTQSKYNKENGANYADESLMHPVPVKVKCNNYGLYSDYAVYYKQGDALIPIRKNKNGTYLSYTAGKCGTYYVVEYTDLTKRNEMFCVLKYGLYKLGAN